MDHRSQPRVGVFREKPGSDIVKQGYMKKLKTMKKKYFILRSTSSSGPARLDYYDSEKKFKGTHPPKRSIPLHTCFNVNKKQDTKHKHGIALFLTEDCFSVIAESEREQEAWLNLLLEYQNEYLVDGQPPKAHYELVWQGVIKVKSPSSCMGITGPYRLCLSDKSVCLIRTKEIVPLFTFQFASIRRCGHSDNCFFMEVGRSSVTGAGELWMQVEETSTAENMHNAVLAEMHNSRTTSTDHSFRRRSNTGSSNVVPIRSAAAAGDEPFHRKRATSESHPHGSPRKSRTGLLHRPQSTVVYSRSNLAPESPIPMGSSPGRTFEYPFDNRLRSDSMSSRSSRTSRHSDMAEPPYENMPGHQATVSYDGVTSPAVMETSYRSMTPEASFTSSTYGEDQLDSSDYLPMTPGQRSMTPSPTRGAASSSDYLAMTPGQMTPGQRSGTPSPTRHIERPGSAGSDGQELSSRSGGGEGYMDMRPGSLVSSLVSSPASVHSGYMDMTPPATATAGSGAGGYLDMTPGQRTPTEPAGSSYMVMEGGWTRTTAPIPIRPTKEPGYIDMGPASQPLPTVKEGGSGEAYLPMSPTGQSPVSSAGLKPAKVISYLSDDSMSGEFPKRAYSVGSRPVPKTQHRYHQPPIEFLRRQPLDNSRSSSAPHLIVQKSRGSQYADGNPRYMDMNQCSSPLSQSIKSDDSDSLMEMDFYRPRTASDSYGSRQRSSSFGKQFMQGHRPRSSSYGQASRGKLAKIVPSGRTDSYESVRTTSQEFNRKHRSQESLSKYSNSSRNSSSESLKKLSEDLKSKKSLTSSDYMDMGFDKRKTPSPNVHGVVSPKVDATGYMDMTLGTSTPKSSSRGISPSSSSHSLGSSPASVGQAPGEKTPDTKVILASGKAMQKQTFGLQQGPQTENQLKVAMSAPRGKKSDKRSPSSSGKESEDESYVPFQPITAAASHEDMMHRSTGVTFDPPPRSHPGLKVQHGYSKSFDSAVKEPKSKGSSKHDKHLKLKIEGDQQSKVKVDETQHKSKHEDVKPAEMERKHSGKQSQKGEKAGKHDKHDKHDSGKHDSVKHNKHDSKHEKHDSKNIKHDSKHDKHDTDKHGKHDSKKEKRKSLKHDKHSSGKLDPMSGVRSPISATSGSSVDPLQEKVSRGHSPTLDRKLDFIPDTDLFSDMMFRTQTIPQAPPPSAAAVENSDSGNSSKGVSSASTPVTPPQPPTPAPALDTSQYMDYCPGAESVADVGVRAKSPEVKKVSEDTIKTIHPLDQSHWPTSRPARLVEREYCEIDLPAEKTSAEVVESSGGKSNMEKGSRSDRRGSQSQKTKPKSPRGVSSAKENENFTYMDFDPAMEKRGEDAKNEEVKTPHRVRSFVAHSETEVEKAAVSAVAEMTKKSESGAKCPGCDGDGQDKVKCEDDYMVVDSGVVDKVENVNTINMEAGNSSISVGNSSITAGNSSILVGNSSISVGSSSITAGNSSILVGNSSISVGNSSITAGNSSILVGNSSISVGNSSKSVSNDKLNCVEEKAKDECKSKLECGGVDKKSVIAENTEDKVVNAKFVVKRTKSAMSEPEVVEDEGYVDLDFTEVKTHQRSSSTSSSNSDKSRKFVMEPAEVCCEEDIPCPETPISYICDDSVPRGKGATGVTKDPGSPFKLTGNSQGKKNDQLRKAPGGRPAMIQSQGNNGAGFARQCSVPTAPCHSPRSSAELHSSRSRKASGPAGYPPISKPGNGGSGVASGKRSCSTSSQLSLDPVPAGQELQKQKSMPCMNIENKKYVGDSVMPEIGQSRHSFTDLTQYEEMSFPAEKLDSGKGRSNSQQQLSDSSQNKMNYAELELHGSAENMEDKSPRIVKSRHPSSIEDLASGQGELSPVSYAEIDYLKTESMKNSGSKEVKFTL